MFKVVIECLLPSELYLNWWLYKANKNFRHGQRKGDWNKDVPESILSPQDNTKLNVHSIFDWKANFTSVFVNIMCKQP